MSTVKKNEAKLDTHNLMSMEEVETLIKTTCKAIWEDPNSAKTIPPLLMHSSPGVGKSSIVRQCAEDLGIGFVDVRLAEMESVDIRGLPSVDSEKGEMRWNAPDFWPRDKKSRGIIFMDELTSCPKDCQVAAYEIILDRKIGEFYKVPDGWYIVAAGNKTTDRAVAMTMSSALANRFMHVEIEADPDQWVKWAQMNDVHPSVTGYIQYRPMNLFSMEHENLERGWPSPRSWHRVSEMCKLYGGNENLLRKVVYGLVGAPKGVEFMEFYKLNRQFDNVLDMMYGKIPVRIPEANDGKYALCSSLIYILWRAKDEEDEKKRLTGFFKIISEMTPDFSAMSMLGAMNGRSKNESSNAARKLFHHPSYKAWSAKYGTALRKRIAL